MSTAELIELKRGQHAWLEIIAAKQLEREKAKIAKLRRKL